MSQFEPGRCEFGVGAVRHLGPMIRDAEVGRVLLATDPGVRDAGPVEEVLGVLTENGIEAVVFAQIEANPSTDCLDRAAAVVRDSEARAVLAVGGGSVLDAAKGIALLATNACSARELETGPLESGLPVIAVPTTAGTGAETNGFGVIEDRAERRKVYLGNDSVRPAYVVLDPLLTLGVPPTVTAATGMDALVHGIESLASRGATPASREHARRAVELVAGSLPTAVSDGADREARSALLLGAHLAGRALTASGLGLVHGLGHAITARCGAAHGLALSAVVAEVMELTLPVAEPAYAVVARALGETSTDEQVAARAVPDRVRELAESVGARRDLGTWGLGETDLEALAATALADPVSRNHPRACSIAELTTLLRGRIAA